MFTCTCALINTERQTAKYRRTDGRTDRQSERKTDRHTYIDIIIYIERQADRQRVVIH